MLDVYRPDRRASSVRCSPDGPRLARIAAEDLGGVSLDEALRVLIFEHRTRAAFARLAADPVERQSYAQEAAHLADADVDVQG